MKIGVTGASGLIGTPLVRSLREHGHDVVRFVRGSATAPDERGWDPTAHRLDPADLADLDAVVHLAGAGVADKRWTAARKAVVLGSRVDGTTTVARAMAEAVAAGQGPRVLLSSSGINYYGDTGDRLTDETGPSGEGFLAEVCRQWEVSTAAAAKAGVRVAVMRTGPVLTGAGGILGRQLLIYKAGLGAPIGSGRQWLSWISLQDTVSAMRHLLTADVEGPVNLVSPAPVTNREFTKAFGRALHRPTLPVPVPGAALRLAIGPTADEMILIGQRLAPAVLQRSDFAFAHSDIDAALRASLQAFEPRATA
jgi:uncharacterized protein (TIGR01777 family)